MRHVLVIEDQFLFAQLMADVALCAGASSVAIAEDEDGAVALAREHVPFLILSDLHLDKGGKGTRAVNRIQQEFGPIPAIYVTGRPDDLGDDTGAAAVLRKPVTPDHLLDVLQRVASRTPARRKPQ